MNPHRVIVLVVFLVVWGLITHGTYAGSGDEPHYLIVAQSLAFDGDLDVANNYAQPDNLIGAGGLEPGLHARPGRDGMLRPIHDIGMPLLFAPYVRVAYPLAESMARATPEWLLQAAKLNASLIFRHLISLSMALLTGLLGVQLYSLFARTATSQRRAIGWALLLTLSPPLLSHAFLFFTEIPSALVVAWLVKVLSDADDEEARPRGWVLHAGWALRGVAIGLLLLIHVRNVALMIVFAAWAIARLRRVHAPRASWALFALGTGSIVLLRTFVVHRFWGTWFTTPIARPDFSMTGLEAAREAGTRAFALLFSRDFGLLVYGPVFVLALFGLWWLRRHPTYSPRWVYALLASYLATLLIPYINPWGVSGGFSPAARMIVPIVPLLALAMFERVQAVPRIAGVLLVLQVAIDAIVWQWPKTLWSGQ